MLSSQSTFRTLRASWHVGPLSPMSIEDKKEEVLLYLISCLADLFTKQGFISSRSSPIKLCCYVSLHISKGKNCVTSVCIHCELVYNCDSTTQTQLIPYFLTITSCSGKSLRRITVSLWSTKSVSKLKMASKKHYETCSHTRCATLAG